MLNGSLVAIVTPMKEDGRLDCASFDQLLRWHLGQGTDGIVVLGTTGESPAITEEERTLLIKQAVDVIGGKVPLIVGTGSNSTPCSIRLTQEAMNLGADAALIVTPYYNKPTQEGLFQHFKAIAEAVSIPQILYNVPSRTGCDLLPETVARLAEFPNIIGLKEATSGTERLQQLLAVDTGLALLSGDDGSAHDFMLAGGQGVISVAANVVPKAFREMCHAALSGDLALARMRDDQLQPLYELLFVESNPIPVKWALSEMGLIPSGIRLPLTPLAEAFHGPLRALLAELNH